MTHRYWLCFEQNFGFFTQLTNSTITTLAAAAPKYLCARTAMFHRVRFCRLGQEPFKIFLCRYCCFSSGFSPCSRGFRPRVCRPSRSACTEESLSLWPGWLRLWAPRFQPTSPGFAVGEGEVGVPGEGAPSVGGMLPPGFICCSSAFRELDSIRVVSHLQPPLTFTANADRNLSRPGLVPQTSADVVCPVQGLGQGFG